MSSMDPEWDTDATYNPLPINLTDQFHSLLTLFTNQMKREIRPVSDHSRSHRTFFSLLGEKE